MEENKFTVTSFSSDSRDVHIDNELNSWTTEFNSEIDLGKGSWEMGIHQIFLNSIKSEDFNSSNNIPKIVNNDTDIILLPKEHREFDKLQPFIDYVLENSNDPFLYDTETYFMPYNDESVKLTPKVLDVMFQQDFVEPFDEEKDISIDVNFKIDSLLDEDAINQIDHPPHWDEELDIRKRDVTLKLPVNRGPYRFREVMQVMLRSFLHRYQGSFMREGDYEKSFMSHNKKGFSEMANLMAKHKEVGSYLSHRLVEKVMMIVHETLKQRKHFQMKPKQVFVYCSLIQSQIVGGMKSKLMHIFNLPDDERNFYNETLAMIDFIPIERRKVRNVSIQLRNHRGDLIKFRKSNFPNHITLVFRKT